MEVHEEQNILIMELFFLIVQVQTTNYCFLFIYRTSKSLSQLKWNSYMGPCSWLKQKKRNIDTATLKDFFILKFDQVLTSASLLKLFFQIFSTLTRSTVKLSTTFCTLFCLVFLPDFLGFLRFIYKTLFRPVDQVKTFRFNLKIRSKI